MKKLIPALILTLAAAGASAREVEREERRVIVPEPAAKLAQLVQFAAASGPAAADLEGVIACVRGFGSVGLAVGAPGAAVLCERTVAHDTLRDQVFIPAAAIAAFDAATGDNLRIVNGMLGYGTGNPAPGLPSMNFTVIRPEHAQAAILTLIAQRERLARPTGPAPRAEPPLGSPDNPCTPPPEEDRAQAPTPAPDSDYDSDGYHPNFSRRRRSVEQAPRPASQPRSSTPDHGSDDDGDPHDQTQEQDPLVSEQK